MSKNNPDLDILAEAHLPSDLLTPTLGSNYGMDGYPDMQYGMGVLDAVVDPELHAAPALPTGVQKGAAVEMALDGLTADSALADLDWLDPTVLSDTPPMQTHTMIPELVEAWGVDRRTDGVVTAHQTDLAYANAQAEKPRKRVNARTLEKVITHAMRRSIEGQHIQRIVREAAESMGEGMDRVVPLLRRVAADHGLAGNVFVRASAYPGWGTGKWKDHVKSHAKQARYIVVSSADLEQAVWIQDGRCAYTGKLAVVEVPWEQAHAHYAPRLEATGRKVASGSPSEALRAAFLSQPRKVEADTGYLPTHETPDQQISREAARATFDAYQPERAVHDPTERNRARRLAKVKVRLAQMERDALIPAGEAKRILASGVDPMTMLRKAAQVAKHVEYGTYESHAPTDAQAALSAQRSSRRLAAQAEHGQRIKSAADEKAIKVVRGFLDRDLITEDRVRHLLAAHKSIQTVADIVAKESAQSLTTKRDYNGMVFKAASLNASEQVALSDENQAISKAASEGGVSVGEIKSMLRGVRRAMSEGFAGSDLTAYLNNRYSNKLISAAKTLVSSAREAHEGLSGFVYVDAEAYASDAGTKGCESGAIKHRANRISNVRAMDRCASCALARVREDGTRKCGAYNKDLINASDVDGPELAGIKQANIKSTSMTDAEVTASYFAPAYDPSEFNLVNASLENVAFDNLPDTERLSGIMFDGWSIE